MLISLEIFNSDSLYLIFSSHMICSLFELSIKYTFILFFKYSSLLASILCSLILLHTCIFPKVLYFSILSYIAVSVIKNVFANVLQVSAY
jgi:hypothetical protein